MAKQNSQTKTWMYLCATTGIVSFLFAMVGFYFHHWFMSGILLLVTIRQAIVFPKWRNKLKLEKGVTNPMKKTTNKNPDLEKTLSYCRLYVGG